MRWAVRVVLALLLLAPSAWLAWEFRDLPHLGLYHDDGVYFVSARALAVQGAYRIESLPHQPWQTKYPIGYPALLALAWWWHDPRWTILLTWIWLPLLLGLSWRLFAQYGFDEKWRWTMCAAIALQPITTVLSVSTMSEVPFTALVVAALLLAGSGWAFTAGLAAGAAFLVRTAGLPLLVSVPLSFALSRRAQPKPSSREHPPAAAPLVPAPGWGSLWRFLAGMAPAVAGWQIWTALHRNPESDIVTLYYADYLRFRQTQVGLSDLPRLLWVNLDALVAGAGKLFFFETGQATWAKLVAWVLAVAAIAGIVRLTRRTGRLECPVFAAGFAALLLVWHYPPDRRFVFPLFPLLAAGLFEQARAIAASVRPSRNLWERVANGVAAGAALCAIGAAAASLIWGTFLFLPGFFEAQREIAAGRREAYAWIRRSTPQDSVLVAYDDVPAYLATGRHAAGFPIPPGLIYRDEPDARRAYAADIGRFAAAQNARYVMLTPGDFRRDLHEEGRDALAAAVRALAGARPVFQSPAASVWELPR